MNSSLSCAVVIPIYKRFEDLHPNELASLHNVMEVLRQRTIVLISPLSLDCSLYLALGNKFGIELLIFQFENHYFRSVEGYNELKMEIKFFEKFLPFDYLLIAQTDSWVFKDEIDEWCKKGYDYIGAPWIDDINLEKVINNKFKWVFNLSIGVQNLIGSKMDWRVGNGGFCLHKVKSSIRALKLFKWLRLNFGANEDLFWGIYVPLIFPFFKVPDETEAMKFAFEMEPEKFYSLNNCQLPFGCHAWEKYNFNFWKRWIKI